VFVAVEDGTILDQLSGETVIEEVKVMVAAIGWV
jgi:hypothetical protein